MKGPLQCAPNTGPRMHSGQNIYMIHAWYFVKLVVKMDEVKRFVDLQCTDNVIIRDTLIRTPESLLLFLGITSGWVSGPSIEVNQVAVGAVLRRDLTHRVLLEGGDVAGQERGVYAPL